MIFSAHLLGVGLALVSALGYGVSDLSGGRAARRHDPFQVLALVGLSGWLVLGGLSLVLERQLPTLASAYWAAGAGFFGALGIAAFYRALAGIGGGGPGDGSRGIESCFAEPTRAGLRPGSLAGAGDVRFMGSGDRTV